MQIILALTPHGSDKFPSVSHQPQLPNSPVTRPDLGARTRGLRFLRGPKPFEASQRRRTGTGVGLCRDVPGEVHYGARWVGFYTYTLKSFV